MQMRPYLDSMARISMRDDLSENDIIAKQDNEFQKGVKEMIISASKEIDVI